VDEKIPPGFSRMSLALPQFKFFPVLTSHLVNNMHFLTEWDGQTGKSVGLRRCMCMEQGQQGQI